MGLCRSLLGDASAAEDAAQEIFLKALKSLKQFRKDSSFSTWLYRIASNRCLDVLRRRSRERTQSLDALLEQPGSQERLPAGADFLSAFENSDLAARMLASLPAEYRLILTLREAQGLSYRELAEALDCSLDAVKARLKRARRSVEEGMRHILESDSV